MYVHVRAKLSWRQDEQKNMDYVKMYTALQRWLPARRDLVVRQVPPNWPYYPLYINV